MIVLQALALFVISIFLSLVIYLGIMAVIFLIWQVIYEVYKLVTKKK